LQIYQGVAPAYIAKANINTTTDEIYLGSGALAGYWLTYLWQVTVQGKNSAGADKVLPADLQEQTIYYLRVQASGTHCCLFYDEEETQKVNFTTENIAEVTTFRLYWDPSQRKQPISCFHSAAATLDDADCCPKDYTINNLPTHANIVYNEAAQVDEGPGVWSLVASGGEPRSSTNLETPAISLFIPYGLQSTSSPGGGPYNRGVRVRDDYADSTKTVVTVMQTGRYYLTATSDNPTIERYRSNPYPHADLPNPVQCYRVGDPSKIATVTFTKNTSDPTSSYMHLPPTCRVVMPQAFFQGDRWTGDNGRYSLGNINEVLTLDTASGSYFSSLKNYYNIPGRIHLQTNFYPVGGRKVVKSNIGYVTGMYMGFKKYLNYDYGTGMFNYTYGVDPEGAYSINLLIERYGSFRRWEYRDGQPTSTSFNFLFNYQPYLYGVKDGQPWFDSRLAVNYANYQDGGWHGYYSDSTQTYQFAVSYASTRSARYIPWKDGAGNSVRHTIESYGTPPNTPVASTVDPIWSGIPEVQKTEHFAICSQNTSCYITSLVTLA